MNRRVSLSREGVTDVVPKGETVPESAALVVTPHPLTVQGQQVLDAATVAMLPGETLGSVLERHGVVPDRQWVVFLGGVEVPELIWHRVRPKHGHLIEARRVVQGGAAKAIARVVATIALVVYAPVIAKAIGLPGAIGTAVVTFAGTMLINKLLPPKLPNAQSYQTQYVSPTYSLSGGRNRARQFEPMALVLGQPYCVPDLAAQPYTYFTNGEQYLWQLFHAGLNCASVNTLRIGQTDIGLYQGVTLSYEGFASGNTGLPLLSNVDTVAGALLDAPQTGSVSAVPSGSLLGDLLQQLLPQTPIGTGDWVYRVSSENTIQLAVDIEASLFSVDSSSGAYVGLSCTLEIEYVVGGGVAWSPFVGNSSQVTLSNASPKPLRMTYSRQVAAGQYVVRARKVSTNLTSSSSQNQIQWSSLKSYQLDTGSYKGQSRLGVQIQASGQLSGSLDEVNLQAVAKPMPYWDGAGWVTATNRATGLCNPGAQLLLLARGIYDEDGRLLAGLGLPDDQIDIDGLKRFMVWCAGKGFEFDYFLQETMSIGDLMDSIAAAGLGEVSFHTGNFGVIWFTHSQPIESVLNMGAMKAKSFSVDYNTQETADELEFQYFDRDSNNSWKSIRVLAPGVTTPSNTARVPLIGVTKQSHAATLARFHMAQNVFLRKTVNFAVDLEHLTFRRGTVMAISHDLTQWGYGGRVQAAVSNSGVVTLTLDDLVPAVGPSGQTARYVGLRIPGETKYRVFAVSAFTGSTRTLTLATEWPSGVALPGNSSSNPAWDTLWIYDFKSTPGQKMRVISVQPEGGMKGAQVSLVPESVEFWDYVWNGDYTPPPNNSLLQGAPVVTGVTVTEQLARQGNTFYTELTATLDVAGSYDHADLWGAVDGGVLQLLASTRNLQMHWRGGLNEYWTLEVRPYSSLQAGARYPLNYAVAGLSVPPSNVPWLALNETRLTWPAISDVDVAGYRVRWLPAGGTDWGQAQPLHSGLLTDSPWTLPYLPSSDVVLLIKAVDTSGNESVSATTVVGALPDPLVANVLETVDLQALGFPGRLGGGSVSGGSLLANNTERIWNHNSAARMWSLDANDAMWDLIWYAPMTYIAKVTTTEAMANAQMTLTLEIEGEAWQVDYRTPAGDAAPMWGDASTPMWSDDAAPMRGHAAGWMPWPGALVAQEGELEIRVHTNMSRTRGRIDALTVSWDVPDREVSLNDVAIADAGTRLGIGSGWHVVKGVHLTLQADGGNARTPIVIDKSLSGPLVKCLDSTGTAVNGTVHATVQGY
jgi:hypothetical protein